MANKPVLIDKRRFDALLQRMLKTPPLPREELRGEEEVEI
jgi:hypothetical protein